MEEWSPRPPEDQPGTDLFDSSIRVAVKPGHDD